MYFFGYLVSQHDVALVMIGAGGGLLVGLGLHLLDKYGRLC